MDPYEQISEKFESKHCNFHSSMHIWKYQQMSLIVPGFNELAHLSLDKMAAISQTFLNAFS